MPELPEVETTVRGLRKVLPGLTITDIWSDYPLPVHKHKEHLKSPTHFEKFKDVVIGAKITAVRRRGKNILIDLQNSHTILVHMKMTGHFLYGPYTKTGKVWKTTAEKSPLADPINQYIRMVFSLSSGKQLAFSDLRKFAKVLVAETKDIEKVGDLEKLGPEALGGNLSVKTFKERLMMRPNGKIKQVLMDQEIITGVGNIYSDELLWEAGVHPLAKPKDLSQEAYSKMFKAMQKILKFSIGIGGDSDSDYRDVEGKGGQFQNLHKAYHQTGKPCRKKGCLGKIVRLKVGGRSAHFCGVHQKKKV